jgi:hypothetical protein
MYSLPKSKSQQGRILDLLQSAHGCGNPLNCSAASCGRVPLPRILDLKISQYGSRVWDLRHRYGFVIDNGPEPNSPDHTWFRLAGRRFPPPDVLEDREIQSVMRTDLEVSRPSVALRPANHDRVTSVQAPPAGLFSLAELERLARWEDQG